MKPIIIDIIFIVALAAVLIILSGTGNMDILFELPFITIYAAYAIGRVAGGLAARR